MTHMNLEKDKTPPLWAVLGAPLIGVPIMVGLLALAAPGSTESIPEPVPEAVSEPVLTEPVGSYLLEPMSHDGATVLVRKLRAG